MSQPIFTDGIGYEGKITLTLKSKNRVLTSKTYKNSGTVELFRFFGYCLINPQDDEAKKRLPSKVRLLYNGSGNPTASNATTNLEARSDFWGYTQTPSIVSSGSDINNAVVKVTYSFEIPKLAIDGDFNQVALYGSEIDMIDEFSAYYYLTNDLGAVESQQPSNWSATTVLLIEWELSLSNKNVAIADGEGV